MSETSTATAPSPSEVRTWAREQGHSVGTRGVLPTNVVDAWNEAHPGRKYRR